jgi:hypothetical protein
LSNFDRTAFATALEKASTNVPRKGLMNELILGLVGHGYGASNVADGWRKIKLPEETLLVQLELGEPIQPDLLSCIVLNAFVPEGKVFPLLDSEYDRKDIPLDKVSVDEACILIDEFYRSALKESKAVV